MILGGIPSIHDVTPEALPAVHALLDLLEPTTLRCPDLLVVPHSGWDRDSLRELRACEERGCVLVGHGWEHRCGPDRTLLHRVHGLVISRDEAEHLSMARAELRELVQRCYDWFGDVGLTAPQLYVPPAWAMGALTVEDLTTLPFRWYERTDGFVEAATGRVRRSPLVGFQADTRTREVALTVGNAANLSFAMALRLPVRIALHPGDPELRLARGLTRMVSRPWRRVRVSDFMDRDGARSGESVSDPRRRGELAEP